MLKKMLINADHPEECRVAVVCDGLLEELDVQVKAREATLGNIYKGVVSRIEPSLQAIFVDFGTGKNGFLSINDIHPSYFPESFEASRRRPRIQDVFKKDDHVLIQVSKEERSTKGACLTTNISLAGRYLVLMPGTNLYGVSRKIEDEDERKKLKEIAKQLKFPENMGFIIRTAGMGRSKTELARDLNYLMRVWESIESNLSNVDAPALLYKEHDIVIRSIREHFSLDISEILVDEKDVYKRVKDFFHQVMPKHESAVRLYQEKRPLFNKYQLEEQVEQVYRRKIKLKSGGYILIEPTEALVTVDVNSGSATKEKGIEDTAFRVNMEAAPEIARQLRLRDLGGIIVIDFIDMSHKKHKQEVERAIKAVLKTDRARTKISRISSLGLLELSRQRLKSSLGTGEYLDCPMCDGRGLIKSPEMSAVSVFRRIKSLIVKNEVVEVKALMPLKTAEYLLNNMRFQLVEMEKLYSSRVTVIPRSDITEKDIIIEAIKEDVQEQSAPEQPVIAIVGEQADMIEPVFEATEAVDEIAPEPEKKKPKRRKRKEKKKVDEAEESLRSDSPDVAELISENVRQEPPLDFAEVPLLLTDIPETFSESSVNSEDSASLTSEQDAPVNHSDTADQDIVTKVEASEQEVRLESNEVSAEEQDKDLTVLAANSIKNQQEKPSSEDMNAGPADSEAIEPEIAAVEGTNASTLEEDNIIPDKIKEEVPVKRKSLLQNYLPFS